MSDYQKEGLTQLDITYEDNSDIMTLIEDKQGVFATLDEELFVPRGSEKGFTDKLLKACEKHRRFIAPRIRDGMTFGIRHFAGDVLYTTDNWLEKNRHAPPQLAFDALKAASNCVVKEMVSVAAVETESAAGGAKRSHARVTVGSNFKKQLVDLMSKIAETQSHYIRCVKPNTAHKPSLVNSDGILHQFLCSGVLEAIRIRKSGYPYRLEAKEFAGRYSIVLGGAKAKGGAPMDEAARIIEFATNKLKVSKTDCVAGKTKIFLRDSAQAALEDRRKVALERPAIKIQSAFRGYRTRKQWRTLFEMNEELKPYIDMGVAADVQGGLFLYPVTVIEDCNSGVALSDWVDYLGELLQQCDAQQAALRPPNYVHVQKIFQRMKKEADVVSECEHLLSEQSTNADKINNLMSRARKHDIKNSTVTNLQKRLDTLNQQDDFSTQLQKAFTDKSEPKCKELLAKKPKPADILRKDISKLISKVEEWLLQQASSKTPTTVAAGVSATAGKAVGASAITSTPTSATGSTRGSTAGTESNRVEPSTSKAPPPGTAVVGAHSRYVPPEAASSSECSEEDFSSEDDSIDWSSDGWSDGDDDDDEQQFDNLTPHELEARLKNAALNKFLRELRTATAECDADQLQFFVLKLDGSALDRVPREMVVARSLLINLADPDWVAGELREAVMGVVWRSTAPGGVARLANLVQQAERHALSRREIEAGKRALACVRVTVTGVPPNGDEAAAGVVRKFELSSYSNLRVNQTQQRRTGKSAANAVAKAMRFSEEDLDSSIVSLDNSLHRAALGMFRHVQCYMTDRAHLDRDSVLDDILENAKQNTGMTDEVYCQVAKQLTHNPRKASEIRGWQLMNVICQSVPPCTDIHPYIRQFISERCTEDSVDSGHLSGGVGQIVQQCLSDFDTTCRSHGLAQGGTQRTDSKTTDKDVQPSNMSSSMTMELQVWLADESRRRLFVAPGSNVASVIRDMAHQLSIDSDSWTVAIQTILKDAQRTSTGVTTVTPVHKVLPLKMSSVKVAALQSPLAGITRRIVFRRRIIAVNERLYPHPTHASLTYKQLVADFKHLCCLEDFDALCGVLACLLVSDGWAKLDNGSFRPVSNLSMEVLEPLIPCTLR
eukprot:Lankesteria_metandrocarpae@DN2892_c0_g1_i1.p1